MEYTIVTHTDMDGVGSAALYIYLQGKRPIKIIFAEPYNLDRALPKIPLRNTGKVVFMDLGMNPNFYNKVVEKLEKMINEGISVEWYDHHVWNDEWLSELKDIGVNINVDRSTCATGVVAKYAPRRNNIDREFIEELVAGVCAGDLWLFNHWRGPWYLRLVRRRESNSWRLRVIDTISKGILWCDEFTENIVDKLEKELKAYNEVVDKVLVRNINSVRVAYVPAHDLVDTSFIAALAMGRTGAEVVVVASRDGKLSFRSRGYNVRELAVKLGGGGHPRASGAKIRIPFKVRLMGLWRPEYYLEYIHRVISAKIE